MVLAPVLPNKAITLISRKGGYKSPACQTFIGLAIGMGEVGDLRKPRFERKNPAHWQRVIMKKRC